MPKLTQAKPLIERADNLLANPAIRPTKHGLPGWQSTFVGCDAGTVQSSDAGTIVQPMCAGHIEIWQEVRAYTNRRYRLDIRMETTGKRGDGEFVAQIQPRLVAFRADKELRTCEPPAMHVGGVAPTIHRAYFQCPEGTGRLQVRLRICTRRPILVKRIRLVECGDYLPTGHPLAVPPEPWQQPPPYLPEQVLLCDSRRDNRPLLAWLGELFGSTNIRRVPPHVLRGSLGVEILRCAQDDNCPDATPAPFADVLMECGGLDAALDGPGQDLLANTSSAPARSKAVSQPPHSMASGAASNRRVLGGKRGPAIILDLPPQQAPSLQDLVDLSDRAIVVASLRTFAGAARRSSIPGICLQDRICGADMPAATIRFAGYHTRGFALADAIPYCWNDDQDDFAHRYLVMSKQAKARFADMGIHISLVSETGQSGTKNHPVCLYRAGQSGVLIIMDPDGLEAPSAGEDVPRVFDMLWRSALGRDTVTAGQFAAPAPHYQGVTTDLVEVAKHFDMLEDLAPQVRLQGQGNPPPMWLWPSGRVDCSPARRTLFVRTGYGQSDWPAIYGLILWLKGLALKSRRNDPLVGLLRERMQVLAWPVTQPHNWRGCPENVTDPHTNLPSAGLAGLIDLAVGQERHTTILVPDKVRAAIVQRALQRSWAWPTEIVIAPQAFGHEASLLCKVLLPGLPQPQHATSPGLTDLVACLLERLAFGLIGWIVPNRTWRELKVGLVPGLRQPCEILRVAASGQVAPLEGSRRSTRLVPGCTVMALPGQGKIEGFLGANQSIPC